MIRNDLIISQPSPEYVKEHWDITQVRSKELSRHNHYHQMYNNNLFCQITNLPIENWHSVIDIDISKGPELHMPHVIVNFECCTQYFPIPYHQMVQVIAFRCSFAYNRYPQRSISRHLYALRTKHFGGVATHCSECNLSETDNRTACC